MPLRTGNFMTLSLGTSPLTPNPGPQHEAVPASCLLSHNPYNHLYPKDGDAKGKEKLENGSGNWVHAVICRDPTPLTGLLFGT